jgi:Uma2 family endonuclease
MIPETVSKKRNKINSAKNGANNLPPLENGDHLTRLEFHRRYEAMPENVKAELIEGVVYMASPVSMKHGIPHGRIMNWLGFYSTATAGTDFADNVTLIVDFDNEPQPDAVLYVKKEFGGNSFINSDSYLEGSPELIVEIAASSKSYDLHTKKRVYQRNGVKEYIVWRVLDEAIDWFVLENGEYVQVYTNEENIIESRFFIGLRLNVKAMIENDLATVLADLQRGLKTKKHKEFISKLKS